MFLMCFLIWLSGALISYCIVWPLMHKLLDITLDDDGNTNMLSLLAMILSWIGVISLIISMVPFIPEIINKKIMFNYPKFLRKLWKL